MKLRYVIQWFDERGNCWRRWNSSKKLTMASAKEHQSHYPEITVRLVVKETKTTIVEVWRESCEQG